MSKRCFRNLPENLATTVMICPFCMTQETKVIDSRLVSEGHQVRRRRECTQCRERFTTFEAAELVMPRIIKQDGKREPFNEDKLRSGMLRALEKRPVSTESIEHSIHRINSHLRATGEREVSSELVGNVIMTELIEMDKVAYVRFASVYHSFEDIKQFSDAIDKLSSKKTKHESKTAMTDDQTDRQED